MAKKDIDVISLWDGYSYNREIGRGRGRDRGRRGEREGSSLFSRPKCGLICPFHIPRYAGPLPIPPCRGYNLRYSTVMYTPLPAYTPI